MNALYWPVRVQTAHVTPRPLPFTLNDLCGHLVADWLPSFVSPIGTDFFGWLTALIHSYRVGTTDYHCLDERLARTERQWKGVVSWMLGVAGARHVMGIEGYRWIAPLSAFYPNAPIVDLALWPRSYPAGVLRAQGKPNRRVKLRPDYLAIRSGDVLSRSRWASVEAKGTDKDLSLTTKDMCPPSWKQQAENLEVHVRNTPVNIARHLVVATRVYANDTSPAARRLQIRAWNAERREVPEPSNDAAVEVAAAHLFGLCMNLRLWQNASAIANAAALRNRRYLDDSALVDDNWRESGADAELEAEPTSAPEDQYVVLPRFRTSAGEIEVAISSATISLIRAMRASDYASARKALAQADLTLDAQQRRRGDKLADGESLSGVRVRFVRAH
jgi:hypothetical protein